MPQYKDDDYLTDDWEDEENQKEYDKFIDELANELTANEETQVPDVKTKQTSRVNKFVFIFLAVFLGFIGAQWFYAKQFKRGFWYLVFSWTLIPMFLGFCQAFKALLQKTDDTYLINV